MEKRGNELMLINKILDAGTDVKFSFLPSQYQVSLFAVLPGKDEKTLNLMNNGQFMINSPF